MKMYRTGSTMVLTAAAIVLASGLCACAGKKTAARGVMEADGDASVATAPDGDLAADDLRRYIDQMDPIAAMDEDKKSIVMDEPGKGMDGPMPSGSAGVFDDVSDMTDPVIVPEPGEGGAQGPARVSASREGVMAEPAPVVEAGASEEVPAAEPVETGEQKLARQIAEMRQTIRELRGDGDAVSAQAVELLALNLLKSGSVEPELDDVKEKLSVGQRKALVTLQSLMAQVREGDEAMTSLDARRLSRLLTEHGDKLAEERPLRIVGSALCTSVQSYGSYTKFSDYTFLQGRAQPVIVYVALENFSQRASGVTKTDDVLAGATFKLPDAKEREKKAADGGKTKAAEVAGRDYVVELTETIAIHNDADDLVVWRAPEASIRDVSRDKRKDYYLVQRIDLPARLTLGRYNVKITVRDTATGATDETVIPIEIVADPAIAHAR